MSTNTLLFFMLSGHALSKTQEHKHTKDYAENILCISIKYAENNSYIHRIIKYSYDKIYLSIRKLAPFYLE